MIRWPFVWRSTLEEVMDYADSRDEMVRQLSLDIRDHKCFYERELRRVLKDILHWQDHQVEMHLSILREDNYGERPYRRIRG